MKISLAPYHAELDRITPMCWSGEVTEVVGLLVESRGPSVAIGDFCEVRTATGTAAPEARGRGAPSRRALSPARVAYSTIFSSLPDSTK